MGKCGGNGKVIIQITTMPPEMRGKQPRQNAVWKVAESDQLITG